MQTCRAVQVLASVERGDRGDIWAVPTRPGIYRYHKGYPTHLKAPHTHPILEPPNKKPPALQVKGWAPPPVQVACLRKKLQKFGFLLRKRR